MLNQWFLKFLLHSSLSALKCHHSYPPKKIKKKSFFTLNLFQISQFLSHFPFSPSCWYGYDYKGRTIFIGPHTYIIPRFSNSSRSDFSSLYISNSSLGSQVDPHLKSTVLYDLSLYSTVFFFIIISL